MREEGSEKPSKNTHTVDMQGESSKSLSNIRPRTLAETKSMERDDDRGLSSITSIDTGRDQVHIPALSWTFQGREGILSNKI